MVIMISMKTERLEADRYIALPDRFEINDYHMMQVFAYEHDERLVSAIQGRGAFRRFKDTAEEIEALAKPLGVELVH